uniref:Mitochondrial fission 1 protein n=1 Tax=Franklinothrips vespiformis TaxID=297892 RepID=A0A481SYB7_FRAVS|nr:hypothetical protein [Franklinothrips vespiformis]
MDEDVLDEVVPTEDLKKFEGIYNDLISQGKITQKAQFEYAWCLVRSKYRADIRKGLILLEELFHTDKEEGKRDYLYYMAIGNARIKEYSKALQFVRGFLEIEPGNQQVHGLEVVIKKRMERDGFKGMAVTGSVLVGLLGIAGIIMLTKK